MLRRFQGWSGRQPQVTHLGGWDWGAVAKHSRDQRTAEGKDETIEYARPEGCLLRLFWMAFGNLALLILAILISERGKFSALDVGYWAVVAALIAARHVDIARFEGQTSHGEPATMQHFRGYVVRVLVVAAALWASAHLVPRLL